MFCSSCGTEVNSDLNYCSRCGRRVRDDKDAASTPENLSASLGYIGGFGFIGYIFVALVLVKNDVPPIILVPITLVYFSALVSVCFMILRQTGPWPSKRTGETPTARDAVNEVPPILLPVNTAKLREANSPSVGSVTEDTTRTLDKVKVERS